MLRDYETPAEPVSGAGHWRNDGHCSADAHQTGAIVSPDFVAPFAHDARDHLGDEGAGQSVGETHDEVARPTNSEAGHLSVAHLKPGASLEGEAQVDATCLPDLRFADPLIAEIVALWRQRQGLTRARVRLELQAQATVRMLCRGDKEAAGKLVKLADKGSDDPQAEAARDLMEPYRMAQGPLEDRLAALDRRLGKLAKALPIWPYAATIKGLGALAMAKIVGEAGDLSKYRTVSAVWKRCGLAVIDGERQRKVANAEAALAHGYDPQRRSVLYIIGECLFKAQGTGDNSGSYRLIYDASKAKHLAKEVALIVAHKRALREMTKAMLKHVTVEWRRIDREGTE